MCKKNLIYALLSNLRSHSNKKKQNLFNSITHSIKRFVSARRLTETRTSSSKVSLVFSPTIWIEIYQTLHLTCVLNTKSPLIWTLMLNKIALCRALTLANMVRLPWNEYILLVFSMIFKWIVWLILVF